MAPIEHFSFTAQTAYQDLVRLLQDAAAASVRGKPTLRKRGGRGYWYDRHRIGDDIAETYIGEDTPELRARLARQDDLRKASRDREREQARLIRLLRAEGYHPADPAAGRLLAAFSRAGMFRLGGTLIGTHAFRLYEAELSVRMPLDHLVATGDIDIASFERLSVALEDSASPTAPEILNGFEFDPVPGPDRNSVWKWRQTRGNSLVEFLTPSFRDDEDIRELPSFGVHARALHFMNYLIAGPIPAALLYRYGVLVQIPRPERFAIHKLIVADRRRDGPDSAKALKDRAQAAYLIEVLSEDRPGDLLEAWDDARSRGANWRRRIDASLDGMPDSRARLADL